MYLIHAVDECYARLAALHGIFTPFSLMLYFIHHNCLCLQSIFLSFSYFFTDTAPGVVPL